MGGKDTSIKVLNLSNNSYTHLINKGINTIEELSYLSMKDITEIEDLELYSVAEILYKLGEYVTEKQRIEIESIQNSREESSDSPDLGIPGTVITELKGKKVLHVIDEGTMEREVADVLFYNNSHGLVGDIEVKDMGLSARSEGVLIRSGLRTAKEIVFADYSNYEKMKGFGKSSREEVFLKLKQIICIQFKSDKNSQLIEKATTIIEQDIATHCPMLEEFQYKNLIKGLIYKYYSLLKDDGNRIIENKELMDRIYSDLSVYGVFKEYLLSILQRTKMISLSDLKEQMPEGMCNSNILLQLINRLSTDEVIDITDDGLCLHLLTIEEYMYTLKEDNSKKVLIYRMQGMTLEEAGSKIGVTRERVRQLTKKALDKFPRLKEDELAYWYENYDIPREEFQEIFELSKEGYGYLTLRYKKGNKVLDELLNDEKITGKIAQKALVEMRKYCVIINESYIPIRRDLLLRKLIEANFSEKECTFSEFMEFYMDFLKKNRLDKNEKLLFPSKHAYESRIVDNKYTLLKYGQRFRYYDMEAYDISALFDELDFDAYDGLEISTLKLFRTHRELMNQYGIWDEYELHNLMKKNEDKLNRYDIVLRRMPFLSIGNADRGRQTVQFLYRVAPVEIYEFADMYEEEFGIKSETVLANFCPYVNKYYHNGFYSIDYEIMSEEEYQMVGSKLVNDMYLIEDVKHLYLEVFPHGRIEKINTYTLKTMGFKIFADYIIKDTYSSSEEYFRDFLQRDEIIDMDLLDKRLRQIQVFQMVLDELRVQFNLLEIEKNKYISFSAFLKKAPGVTKADLEKFAMEASSYTDDEFFTIQSIRKDGFISNIDYLDFSNWFFGALLRSCKDIYYSKVAGGFLFSHLGRQFKRSDFFLFIMKRLIKIHIMGFIDFISNHYGLCFERYDVTSVIGQSSMYYNPATEIIYLCKEIYYKDII